MEEKSIFRKKSIERVTSPEQLNDYIKVTTPSVWLILIAMLLLIVGMLVWAVFGKIQINSGNGVSDVICGDNNFSYIAVCHSCGRFFALLYG